MSNHQDATQLHRRDYGDRLGSPALKETSTSDLVVTPRGLVKITDTGWIAIGDEAGGFISEEALQELLRNSRDEDVARQVMEEFPEQWREELIRYWQKEDRLHELPLYYTWLIRKFYEIRRARPL